MINCPVPWVYFGCWRKGQGRNWTAPNSPVSPAFSMQPSSARITSPEDCKTGLNGSSLSSFHPWVLRWLLRSLVPCWTDSILKSCCSSKQSREERLELGWCVKCLFSGRLWRTLLHRAQYVLEILIYFHLGLNSRWPQTQMEQVGVLLDVDCGFFNFQSLVDHQFWTGLCYFRTWTRLQAILVVVLWLMEGSWPIGLYSFI